MEHWGFLGDVGVLGPLGVLGGIRGCMGADRECRYSGTRRGIGSIRGHWGSPRGVGGY